MFILKKINKFLGIVSLLSLVIMEADLILMRDQPIDMIFYYSCGAFLILGAIFLLTAAVFVLYDFVISLRHKRMGLFIRHYLYAVGGFYIVCILFDYVVSNSVNLLNYFLPSLALGVIQIYISGYKKAGQPETAD